MTPEEIRLTTLRMAIEHTTNGTSWTAILTVASRFEHYITTGQDNKAGLSEGEY